MEKNYVTVDELTKLKSLNNELVNLECEIGKLEILKQLNVQKHLDMQKLYGEFNNVMNQKYGDCQINLETGEISKPS